MNGFLLDTNIPSEMIRTRPEPRVERWVFAQQESSLYLSVVTIAELRRGFVMLPAGKRRSELERWFTDDLLPRFSGRVLPVTHAIADRWGAMDGASQMRGRRVATADGLIAATALEHNLTLVTRNTSDFSEVGVTVLNPWEE